MVKRGPKGRMAEYLVININAKHTAEFSPFGERIERRNFGGVKVPKSDTPTTAPQVEDKAVQEAVAEATRNRKAAKGYRSTVLSRNMMAEQGDGTRQLMTTLGS